MKRMLLIFGICLLGVMPLGWSAQGRGGNQDSTVTTMTRNMYPGADLGAVVEAQTPEDFDAAVQATMEGVIQSRIAQRAALIAAEIVENKPDLVALQEATKWKIKSKRGMIVLDQLELLLDSLRKAGQHYRVAAMQKLTDVQIKGAISYTDHDAILVRSDRPLNVIGSEMHIYDNLLEFPIGNEVIQILRGWIAVDVKLHGCRFKFINTHLESPLPGDLMEATQYLQLLQAQQLVNELSPTSLPVILAGDFNTDAEHNPLGYPPDETLSYGLLLESGYADSWHKFHMTSDHGYTWPLFLEGFGDIVDPIERIDLILTNRLETISMERIGTGPVGGLFASDHAGMVAVFQLPDQR